jgi:tetratricopeptide (TPR) repeat protein
MRSSLPRRRLIPRWRPTIETLGTAEARPLYERAPTPVYQDDEAFERSLAELTATPTPGHVGDVLAFSIHSDLVPQVVEATRHAVTKGVELTSTQKALLESLQGGGSDRGTAASASGHPLQPRIQGLRRLLCLAPDNALVLLDFAQLQLATGKADVARRALRTALGLAPSSRLATRTFARFLVHMDRADEALSLVRRHARVDTDPWLMATEIALADLAETSSQQLTRARRLLKSKEIAPSQLAELAGAVASAELYSGQVKAARENLRQALTAPTDNVLAQAVTEQQWTGIRLDDPAVSRAMRHANEAALFAAWNASDTETAEAKARAWHEEEPFSSRPIQFLSTLYSLKGDYGTAKNWVELGLRADPKDEGLLANHAFTLASSGKLKQAEQVVRRLLSSGGARIRPYVTATQGLVALHRGNAEQANRLYRTAMDEFRKAARPDLVALCMAHYAKAAVEMDLESAEMLVLEAIELEKQASNQDVRLLLASFGVDAKHDDSSSGLRRTSQWIFDRESNSLMEKKGITARGAPSVVVQKASSRRSK